MNTKPLYQSKTFWINFITMIGSLFPVIQEWIRSNPVAFVEVLGAINLLVRFVTKERVILWNNSAAKSMLPLLLMGVITASMFCVSCQVQGISEVQGRVFYKGESGAKGGLVYRDGKFSPYVKAPLRDADGNVVGEFEIEATK